MTLTLDVELPGELGRFRLPKAVAARLRSLLDQQDAGHPLTSQEREEAEGLANLADLLTLTLTLMRLRAERVSGQ